MGTNMNESHVGDYDQLTETQRDYIRREVFKGLQESLEGKGRPADEFFAEMEGRYTTT